MGSRSKPIGNQIKTGRHHPGEEKGAAIPHSPIAVQAATEDAIVQAMA